MIEQETKRIAMWSGPRNISTAMMRAFENRPDCVVWDEPFYAAYLVMTGIDHPMRDEVIAAGLQNPKDVVAAVTGPVPYNAPVYYQKHMLQHMVPDMPRGWLGQVDHAFLIRDPAKMVASYAKKRAEVSAEDLGYVKLDEIYNQVASVTGTAPPVLDADDILSAPEAMLSALCASLGIPFTEKMLSWPEGERQSDGAWAPHWYGAVWKSTGFQKPAPVALDLDNHHQQIADACMPYYEKYKALALTAH